MLTVLLALVLAAGCGKSEPVSTQPTDAATSAAPGTDATSSQAVDTTVSSSSVVSSIVPVSTVVATGNVLRVPEDGVTIQAVVDKAKPGDLVLIGPGTYREAVVIRTPGVVLRGSNRNTVVLDGGDELSVGITAATDGVAIENLTVHNYLENGVVFTKQYDATEPGAPEWLLRGYRASYVTSYNNGLYGVYAYFAADGQFDHLYVSGHPDSGVYIGQCKPCNAVVTDVLAERNAVGYEGTNASGNLFVINSIWRKNRIGMTPNSQDAELLAPQGDVVLAGNLVIDNVGEEAPASAKGGFGYGVAIGGGERNQVVRNRIVNNPTAGVAVTDLSGYMPSGNTVEDNVLERNGVDLVFGPTSGATTWEARENCFARNTFATDSPKGIESVLPCEAPRATQSVETPPPNVALNTAPPDVDYRKVVAPEPQPDMPNAESAPAVPAFGLPAPVDLGAISTPKGDS